MSRGMTLIALFTPAVLTVAFLLFLLLPGVRVLDAVSDAPDPKLLERMAELELALSGDPCAETAPAVIPEQGASR